MGVVDEKEIAAQGVLVVVVEIRREGYNHNTDNLDNTECLRIFTRLYLSSSSAFGWVYASMCMCECERARVR